MLLLSHETWNSFQILAFLIIHQTESNDDVVHLHAEDKLLRLDERPAGFCGDNTEIWMHRAFFTSLLSLMKNLRSEQIGKHTLNHRRKRSEIHFIHQQQLSVKKAWVKAPSWNLILSVSSFVITQSPNNSSGVEEGLKLYLTKGIRARRQYCSMVKVLPEEATPSITTGGLCLITSFTIFSRIFAYLLLTFKEWSI